MMNTILGIAPKFKVTKRLKEEQESLAAQIGS
jgi:hypothetical protein